MHQQDRHYRAAVREALQQRIKTDVQNYHCHHAVFNEHACPSMYRQCYRHSGHGRAGLYCSQHKERNHGQLRA